MPDSPQPGGPVTAADVEQAVALALAGMRDALAADWHTRAGTLEWDCWETVEHMSDDLFGYAAQLGPRNPPLRDPVPFACAARRPGGPVGAISVGPGSGPAGLLQVFEATGALLATMVAASRPYPVGQQPFGVADPTGFAATIGVAEVLVHMRDVAQGLGIVWAPPGGLCRRALTRLFPDAPAETDPWTTLLWATGRGELAGYPTVTSWRWHTGRPAT
ncbi:MAG TPA: hypothetical protein VGS19_11435 [Streptosporangiaceae bacterium]|nr:hypothetical protein [Streptosporangiaceae bacterium]